MPSHVTTAAVLVLVAVALMVLAGGFGLNFLAPQARSTSISVVSAELIRGHQQTFFLVFTVVNTGSETVTLSNIALTGAGNPSCILRHVKGSTTVKPSENVELTYTCTPITIGQKYMLRVSTQQGAVASAAVTAVG